MKKFIKRIFINDKNSYILSNMFFISISIIISVILINSNDISVRGGIILGIFQLFIFNTLWLAIEIKFKLDDINKTKIITDKIIQEFAESELLQNKLVTTLIKDLSFDKNVKKNLHHIEKAYLYISKVKIEDYFSEFFVYDPERNQIRDVPSAYFEDRIWKYLVNNASFYYSTQRLITTEQLDYYLGNENRKRIEINTLTNRTGWAKDSFCKLFVIDSDYLDTDDKIKKETTLSDSKYARMYNYLKEWHEDVGKKKGFSIKVANAKKALGHQNEDVGIFGNFYGIQRNRNIDEKKIMREDLKIDFYFNHRDAEERSEKFLKFFKSSETILLTDAFFS